MKLLNYIILFTLPLSACKVATPFSPRKQLLLFKPGQFLTLSEAMYRKEISRSRVCKDSSIVDSVEMVANNLIQAVNLYYTAIGQQHKLRHYKWEVTVIDNSKVVNATCRPGGKIIIYTGILPIAKNQNGLATILGHEIAHTLANHSAERLSLRIIACLGAAIPMSMVVNAPYQVRIPVGFLSSAGASYCFILPYKRLHESESDKIGLFLTALAGYDPHEAPKMWERMALSTKRQPKEFLSTHPSHKHRVRNLEKLIPDALAFAGRWGSQKPHPNFFPKK